MHHVTVFVVQFILLSISTTIIADIIWQSPMNSNYYDDWTFDNTNNILQYKDLDSDCPSFDKHCWELCNDGKSPNDAYIYRIVSTVGYTNISVTFSVNPYSMSGAEEYCSFQYNINNIGDTVWSEFYQYGTDEVPNINQIQYLNKTTSNNIGVGIKIEALDDNLDCCLLRNIYLSGTPINSSTDITYRTINGAWNDDYMQQPLPGWTFVGPSGGIYDIVNVGDNDQLYHGPYEGDSNGFYSLQQHFYCKYDSSVDISYTFYFCNTELGDYVQLSYEEESNSMQFQQQHSTSQTNVYTDSALDTYCAGNWYYSNKAYQLTSSISKDIRFSVTFIFVIDSGSEYMAISQIQLTCNALNPPTNGPTTTNPTAATFNQTTLLPTTAAPTTSMPTTVPTAATTNPTTSKPTTALPTTAWPTASNLTATTTTPASTNLTTSLPTTAVPTTSIPTANSPNNVVTTYSDMLTTEKQTTNPILVSPTTDSSTQAPTRESKSVHTVITTLHTKSDGQENDQVATSFIYILIGAVICLCCLISILFVVKKRHKKQLHDSNKTQNIQLHGINVNNKNAGIVTISPTDNNIQRIVSLSSDNESNFEANLTNLAGANSLLMDDVIADVNDVNDGDQITTAGGPDIDMNETDENTNDEDETPPTNENDFINDHVEVIDEGARSTYNNNNNINENFVSDKDEEVIGDDEIVTHGRIHNEELEGDGLIQNNLGMEDIIYIHTETETSGQ